MGGDPASAEQDATLEAQQQPYKNTTNKSFNMCCHRHTVRSLLLYDWKMLDMTDEDRIVMMGFFSNKWSLTGSTCE